METTDKAEARCKVEVRACFQTPWRFPAQPQTWNLCIPRGGSPERKLPGAASLLKCGKCLDVLDDLEVEDFKLRHGSRIGCC